MPEEQPPDFIDRPRRFRWWIVALSLAVPALILLNIKWGMERKIGKSERTYSNKPSPLELLERSDFYKRLPANQQSEAWSYVLERQSDEEFSPKMDTRTVQSLIEHGFIKQPSWPGYTTYAAEGGAFLLIPKTWPPDNPPHDEEYNPDVHFRPR